MTREPREFEITEDHLRLARRMYVGWDGCEFGAPAVDCKRPYGNSDVIGDMLEILGLEWSQAQEEKMHAMHAEMATVLQIGLRTGAFIAGRYVASRYGEDWMPVD